MKELAYSLVGFHICPNCGAENKREWKQCPAYRGMAVCTDCCKACKEYQLETYRCHWHRNHAVKDNSKEFDAIANQIKILLKEAKKKEGVAAWLRRQGKAQAGKRVEQEGFTLKEEVIRLKKKREKMKDEEEKQKKRYSAAHSDCTNYYRI